MSASLRFPSSSSSLVHRKFSNPHDMALLLGAVFALSVFWFALLRVNTSYTRAVLRADLLDLLLITWTVNRTGGVDSYFPTFTSWKSSCRAFCWNAAGLPRGDGEFGHSFCPHGPGVLRRASRRRKRGPGLAGAAVHHQPEHFRLLRGCLPCRITWPRGCATRARSWRSRPARWPFCRLSATASSIAWTAGSSRRIVEAGFIFSIEPRRTLQAGV